MKKDCYTCRYQSIQMYNKNICKSPNTMEINFDEGFMKKEFKVCSNINLSNDCKHWKPTLFRKIKLFVGKIQMMYYKRKHPEWFI